MTDQNSQFFAILTAVGEAKQANANALGVPWTFAQMGVGDANNTDPIPSRAQTRLINERRRAPLNQIKIDPANASIIIAEQVIPPDVGGWWIREIGLYDAAGDLVAVANCAPSFKPLLAQGTGKTQVVRLNIVVTSTANIQLKIDPAVVLATRDYVDSSILSVLPPNKPAGTYTKVQFNERGIFVAGSNPTTLAGYGIIDALQVGVVSTQRPVLAAATPGDTLEDAALIIREAKGGITVQHNEAYAPSIAFYWFGKAAAKLAMTSLGDLTWRGQKVITTLEQDLMTLEIQKKAPLDSPDLKGTPAAPTAPPGSRNKQIANTEFVRAEFDALIAAAPGALDTLAELAAALGNDPNFATTVTTELAKKAAKATTLAGYGIGDALKVGAVSRQQPLLSAPTAGETVSDTALLLREGQEVAATKDTDSYAPSLGFHWSGKTAGRLIMDALGVLKWRGKPLLTGKYATFDELNEGASDETVVSPFKLRWGFSFLVGGTGYIQFPPWLGGFMLQWGIASGVPKAGTAVGAAGPTRDVILPVAFTADVFRVFATMNFTTMAATAAGAASSAGTPGAMAISKSVIRLQNNYSGSDGEISWFAIGR